MFNNLDIKYILNGGIVMKQGKKLTFLLFIVYLIILTWIILFKMQFSIEGLPHFRGFNLIPFGDSVIINGKIDLDEIINNMIAFVPVGVYVSMLKPNWSFFKKILPAFSISFLYETLQFILGIGASDITDLISNTVGGIAGIGFVFLASRILKSRAEKVLNILAAAGTVCVINLMCLLLFLN